MIGRAIGLVVGTDDQTGMACPMGLTTCGRVGAEGTSRAAASSDSSVGPLSGLRDGACRLWIAQFRVLAAFKGTGALCEQGHITDGACFLRRLPRRCTCCWPITATPGSISAPQISHAAAHRRSAEERGTIVDLGKAAERDIELQSPGICGRQGGPARTGAPPATSASPARPVSAIRRMSRPGGRETVTIPERDRPTETVSHPFGPVFCRFDARSAPVGASAPGGDEDGGPVDAAPSRRGSAAL
ncbi:hypothetical protein SAMN05421539_10546 [Jannaschia seohaensis]|uniref:Uncharacterized protein n=1 Tax=Jannaschia seohaensis TaxID=475081 RepID=A0A2Y9C7S2_9RHOB|nr:hypothetical protein BCF38_10546 [Jannaschia seohaensis]SSA46583.1 hypothetical protein SAMN05421539_10546 [Jannaschia seohaensis]